MLNPASRPVEVVSFTGERRPGIREQRAVYPMRDEHLRAWTVYSSAGRRAATIILPPRFTLLQVGTDFVLGVQLGEDDVEHMVVYALDEQWLPQPVVWPLGIPWHRGCRTHFPRAELAWYRP